MSIKSVKRIAAFILAMILVLPGLSFGAGDDKAGDNAKEVAKVNEIVITQGDMNSELGRLKSVLMQRGQMPGDADMQTLKKVAVDSLIEQELLYQASMDLKIKVDQAALDAQYDALLKKFPDEKSFDDILDKMNITRDTLKKQMARTQYIQNYITEEFVQKAQVSDDEAKTFYDANIQFFKVPETVKVSHILISVDAAADEKAKADAKAKLEKIKTELAGGADFAELAKTNSDCPSKDQGGDLGFISRDQVVEPFANAAFALKPGEMSDIVETQFGYHLIKAFEHKDASTMPLEEVKDKIASHLKQEKVKKDLAQKVADLKKAAKIEILDPDLKAASQEASPTDATPADASKKESSEAPQPKTN